MAKPAHRMDTKYNRLGIWAEKILRRWCGLKCIKGKKKMPTFGLFFIEVV